MKRTTTLLCSLLLTIGVMAQKETGGLGFQIGYAAPTLRINAPYAESAKTLETTPMNGLKLGINYDATIIQGFGTMIGLNYTFGTYQSKWSKT